MTGSKCSITPWTTENKQDTFHCFADTFSALPKTSKRCPTDGIKKTLEVISKVLTFIFKPQNERVYLS